MRTLRAVILTSIGVGAALGIVALIGFELGDTGWSVIWTSFLISAGAVVAMPSVAAWDEDRVSWLPLTAAAAAFLGFAWLIVGIWVEFEAEFLWKIPFTLIVYAIAVGVVGMLATARLAPSQQPIIVVARTGVVIVAAMIVLGMWAEIDVELYWRVFGVAAVLMTAALAPSGTRPERS